MRLASPTIAVALMCGFWTSEGRNGAGRSGNALVPLRYYPFSSFGLQSLDNVKAMKALCDEDTKASLIELGLARSVRVNAHRRKRVRHVSVRELDVRHNELGFVEKCAIFAKPHQQTSAQHVSIREYDVSHNELGFVDKC